MTKEEAITELSVLWERNGEPTDGRYREALDMAISALSENKGEWIRWYEKIEGNGVTAYEPHCKCSKCNKEQDPYASQFINFCPNCGADMRETCNGCTHPCVMYEPTMKACEKKGR